MDILSQHFVNSLKVRVPSIEDRLARIEAALFEDAGAVTQSAAKPTPAERMAKARAAKRAKQAAVAAG